jgi:hypothetical protein
MECASGHGLGCMAPRCSILLCFAVRRCVGADSGSGLSGLILGRNLPGLSQLQAPFFNNYLLMEKEEDGHQ